MQWWCAAQGTAWTWDWQPYPGVWLFVIAMAALYVWLVRSAYRWKPGSSTERPWTIAAGIAGLLSLWIALDWPVGALGAGYLASVHMVQYLMIALAAPPLLLLGTPEAAYARLGRTRRLLSIVRTLTRPPVALLAFILAAGITHVPAVVDALMVSQAGNFAIDMAWLLTGLMFWWPIVAPVPARPNFPPPAQVLYLFPATLAHTAIAAFLVFSRFPVYATYELAPPTGWVTALGDQQMAGGLMWVAATPIMWSVIAIFFFRWMATDPMRAASTRPSPAPALDHHPADASRRGTRP